MQFTHHFLKALSFNTMYLAQCSIISKLQQTFSFSEE